MTGVDTTARQHGDRRVLVAGMGAVTSQGVGVAALWEGVRAGQVGIRAVQRLDLDGYRTKLGGQAPLPDEPTLDEHGVTQDLVLVAAHQAAAEAMQQAQWVRDAVPAERWGVVIGTCNAGLLSARDWLLARDAGRTSPARQLLQSPPQAIAESLAGEFGLRGPAVAINTACAASANAIGYAADLVRTGAADAVLVGGADVFSDVLFAGFHSLESLSAAPAAPYSGNRSGLSLGEGSGMLVLVRDGIDDSEAADRLLGQILGYGLSADGYHVTAPDPSGRGASRAIEAALRRAGVDGSEVGYINGHGTGTAKNDSAETAAIRRALGDAADKLVVSSTKSMIGHLLGAAGAVEAIVTLKALQTQVAPPTAGWLSADPACDLDYVANTAREMSTDVALSTNFAFAGANACLALARPGTRLSAVPAAADRVMITGMSAITPDAASADDLAELVFAGDGASLSAAGQPEDPSEFQVGRVAIDAGTWLSARERRRMDRICVLSVIAAKQALADAGIDPRAGNGHRIGVVLGTGIGPMESMENFARPVVAEGAAAANPAVFPNTVYNAAAGHVAMHTGAVGPTSTLSVSHASGSAAIGYAQTLLEADQADAIVCIGVDTLTDQVVRGYTELGLVRGPGLPGMRLTEGVVALVLERAGVAAARNAPAYGELAGHAITGDGRGLGSCDPDGTAVERSMAQALQRAGVEPAAVPTVWASAAGLSAWDSAEERAVSRLFEGRAHLARPKLALGEPMGASGPLGVLLALLAWRHGAAAAPVLVNSASLGGTYVSLVLRPVLAEQSYAGRHAERTSMSAEARG
jgi:3-oxoacyl-[acyl-carrier-protein] synthase II